MCCRNLSSAVGRFTLESSTAVGLALGRIHGWPGRLPADRLKLPGVFELLRLDCGWRWRMAEVWTSWERVEARAGERSALLHEAHELSRMLMLSGGDEERLLKLRSASGERARGLVILDDVEKGWPGPGAWGVARRRSGGACSHETPLHEHQLLLPSCTLQQTQASASPLSTLNSA